jgi:hypothetical protein
MSFMFNLDDYEDVAARVLRFQKAYPEGRIVTDVIQFNPEKGIVLVSAQVYRNANDTLPAGVDYAFGDASTYNAGMRKWYVEDTSSSAIGRALSLVLETQKKPTRQDMSKVVAAKPAKPPVQEVKADDQDYWTTPVGQYNKVVDAPVTLDKAMETVAAIMGTPEAVEAPSCEHGHMQWKEGEKNNKKWGGYFCNSAISSAHRCPTKWYNLNSEGKFEPQKAWA